MIVVYVISVLQVVETRAAIAEARAKGNDAEADELQETLNEIMGVETGDSGTIEGATAAPDTVEDETGDEEAKFKASVMEYFQKLDTDQDGYLSINELRDAMKAAYRVRMIVCVRYGGRDSTLQ